MFFYRYNVDIAFNTQKISPCQWKNENKMKEENDKIK